jgi:hypothetical protein
MQKSPIYLNSMNSGLYKEKTGSQISQQKNQLQISIFSMRQIVSEYRLCTRSVQLTMFI